MSHVSKMKTKIKVTSEKMMDSLKQCAKEIGASIRGGLEVKSPYGQTKTIKNGFVAEYNGLQIGVCNEGGRLTYAFDMHGRYGRIGKQFTSKLEQAYKKKAITSALTQMGYRVQVKQKGKQTLIVGVG